MSSNVDFYEAFATEYEHYYAVVDVIATVKQWLTLLDAEQILTLAETRLKQPLDLLDLGCGPGWHISPWRSAGFRVTGLDVSPAMLRLAAKHGAGPGTSTPLYCADVRDAASLSPLAGGFDLIVSHFNFLNLFPPSELITVFTGVAKLLRDGGHWMTDVTDSSVCLPSSLAEINDSWQREIASPSPGVITVLWRCGGSLSSECYWLHEPQSLKAAAAAVGMRLRFSRDWRPENPGDAWCKQDKSAFRHVVVMHKPL